MANVSTGNKKAQMDSRRDETKLYTGMCKLP